MPFEDALLAKVYARELYWLCWQICSLTDELRNRCPPSTKAIMRADPESPGLVYSALSCAAKVHNLLHEDATRRHRPDLVAPRADYLRGLLGDLELPTICDKEARNSIEHYDERLDNVREALTACTLTGKYYLAENLVFSSLLPSAAPDPDFPYTVYTSPVVPGELIVPLRVYSTTTETFYTIENKRISVFALRQEAEAIMERLTSFFDEAEPADWVSSWSVIGPT